MLEDLDEWLNARNISLVFAEMKDPVRTKIERYELTRTIDPRHFFPTLDAAVDAYQAEFHERWQPGGGRMSTTQDRRATSPTMLERPGGCDGRGRPRPRDGDRGAARAREPRGHPGREHRSRDRRGRSLVLALAPGNRASGRARSGGGGPRARGRSDRRERRVQAVGVGRRGWLCCPLGGGGRVCVACLEAHAASRKRRRCPPLGIRSC